MGSDEAFDRPTDLIGSAEYYREHLRRLTAHAVGERLRALGAALVQAAALSKAYVRGYSCAAYEMGCYVDPTNYWAPGCQRQAP